MLGGFGFGQSFALQVAASPATGSLPAASAAPREQAAAIPARPWHRARGAPRHILVPLDGSDCAEQALPAAESLCKTFDARLTLVSVLPKQPMFRLRGRPGAQPDTSNGGRRETRSYLLKIARSMRARGIDVTTSVLTGPVVESVNRFMEEQAIDMSVISTHGRSGLQRWMPGSVANRLIQLATRPVLAIHPAPGDLPPVPGFGKLLVALDGSEFAERVLPMVRASTLYGSVVLLLRVPEAPQPYRFGAMVEEIEQLRREAEAEASRYLEDIAVDLRAEGIETDVLVIGSRPAETIIRIAEEEDVDVIMLSSHGQGEFDNLLVGSVANRVVQQTHRPVLLVPIQERRTPQS
jgi:nucleotide-binding universal stress UspA family protein